MLGFMEVRSQASLNQPAEIFTHLGSNFADLHIIPHRWGFMNRQFGKKTNLMLEELMCYCDGRTRG